MDKNLVPIQLKQFYIDSFFTFFKGYIVICNNTKDYFSREPEKINVKFHKNCENTGKILKISFVRFIL